MFTFEGAAYDLVAAAVGRDPRARSSPTGWCSLIARAFGAENDDAGLQIEYAVTWQSLLIAFALGVLLTLVVVAFSAWRVSVDDGRDGDPEPARATGACAGAGGLYSGGLGLAVGALLVVSGGINAATPLMLGVSLGDREPRPVRAARRNPRPDRVHASRGSRSSAC